MEIDLALRNALLGATLLGIAGGVLGSFAVLRRQSLLGDALAHAALPGVCLGFLVSGSKSAPALFGGALVTGLLGALAILLIVRSSRIKEDAATGIVLSVFFGVGIVLLTVIQRMPTGNKAGLDKFLFGQAATLLSGDVALIAVVGAVAVAFVVAAYKELALITFDAGFAQAQGVPVRALEITLTVLLVAVVVVGLQAVGVVLVVATLVTPAATARQWTNHLSTMVVSAGALGGSAGALGAYASSVIPRLPTGPTIVLLSSGALVVSLLLAPKRGLLWRRIEAWQVVARVRRENLLKDLYRLGEAHDDFRSFVPWPVLMGVRGQPSRQLARLATRLETAGLIEREADALRLTAGGLAEARQLIRKHRLWELYLTVKLDLASNSVHRDAEQMEHALTDETALELERVLGNPQVDPHGRAIPPARTA